jgi:threonine dehydrogenase-like Zn-dependent dehydrogenase
MMLLARPPERILALRLAMSSSIGPPSVVLDAGCGSLGVLAIMAARLGARRVVAIDIGRLDAAQALAEENGVADRIEFRQCNTRAPRTDRSGGDRYEYFSGGPGWPPRRRAGIRALRMLAPAGAR